MAQTPRIPYGATAMCTVPSAGDANKHALLSFSLSPALLLTQSRWIGISSQRAIHYTVLATAVAEKHTTIILQQTTLVLFCHRLSWHRLFINHSPLPLQVAGLHLHALGGDGSSSVFLGSFCLSSSRRRPFLGV